MLVTKLQSRWAPTGLGNECREDAQMSRCGSNMEANLTELPEHFPTQAGIQNAGRVEMTGAEC